MSVSNARMTIGALLGTATQGANMVTTTFTTVSDAVGMVGTAVHVAATKQKVRADLDLATFDITAQEEAIMRLAAGRKTIIDFCSKEGNKELYDACKSDLLKAIETRKKS